MFLSLHKFIPCLVSSFTLYGGGGGGGGDGGAAERKAAEDRRIAQAIKQVNAVFGIGQFEPVAVDQNAFMQEITGRGSQPVNAPQGYTLINKQGTKTPSNSLGVLSGRGVTTNTQYLFNKDGYDKAVAESVAEAERKNAAAKEEREKLYGKVATDFTNNSMVDLNKERDITARDLNFQLARQGLSGGSRDVDANAEVTDRYNQGVLRANNEGVKAANNARSADTSTRQKIVNSIQAGLTADQATQQAYEGMSNNAKAAADEASTASLAGFFDALRATQQQQAYNAGYGSTTPATPSYRTNPYFNTGSSYSGSSGKY